MIKKILGLVFNFYFVYNVFAQRDYDNWSLDRIIPQPELWYKALITTPRYMGPNALPMPEIKSGTIKDEFSFSFFSDNYFQKDDFTISSFSRVYIPIAKNKVAIEAYGTPVEYFETSDKINAERNVVPWFYDKNNRAAGDLYVSTIIQIIHQESKNFDLALSFTTKTASGTGTPNARFTDTPGYFFDVSMGKKYNFSNHFFESLKVYGMLGFYSWQTYSDRFPQDDAYIFGIGGNLKVRKWLIQQSFGGYVGYLQGDKPLVYRLNILYQKKRFDYNFGYQAGLHDFPFQSLRAGMTYKINIFEKKNQKNAD